MKTERVWKKPGYKYTIVDAPVRAWIVDGVAYISAVDLTYLHRSTEIKKIGETVAVGANKTRVISLEDYQLKYSGMALRTIEEYTALHNIKNQSKTKVNRKSTLDNIWKLPELPAATYRVREHVHKREDGCKPIKVRPEGETTYIKPPNVSYVQEFMEYSRKRKEIDDTLSVVDVYKTAYDCMENEAKKIRIQMAELTNRLNGIMVDISMLVDSHYHVVDQLARHKIELQKREMTLTHVNKLMTDELEKIKSLGDY